MSDFELKLAIEMIVGCAAIFALAYWAAKRRQRKRYTLAELGPMLLAERKRRKVSQVRAAAECGLTAAVWSRIECGRSPHQVEQLQKLAGFLGLEGRDFL